MLHTLSHRVELRGKCFAVCRTDGRNGKEYSPPGHQEERACRARGTELVYRPVNTYAVRNDTWSQSYGFESRFCPHLEDLGKVS